jgi:hypothetical protein
MNSTTPGPDAAAAPKTLAASELEQARLFIEQARNGAVGATKGLSEAQWKFKPATGGWSIAEIAEHMVVVQERILGGILDKLATAPPAPADHDCAQVDSIVINQFPNRLSKFKGPESAHPTGRYAPNEAVERLVRNCGRLTECLESVRDLRQHCVDSLPLKAVSKGAYNAMDGYQWILAAAAHTERHTKQILEVMADPKFPEK